MKIIDYEVVVKTVKQDLPSLIEKLKKLIEEKEERSVSGDRKEGH